VLIVAGTDASGVKRYFGGIFDAVEPSGGIVLPGTLKLDLPIVAAKGWFYVVLADNTIVKVRAEV
jgi:hypothetical protein